MSKSGVKLTEVLREDERARNKRKSAKQLQKDREDTLKREISDEQAVLKAEFYARMAKR